MIVRAGFIIVAVVSAIKVCQISINLSRKPSSPRNKDEKASRQQEEQIEKKNGRFEESHVKPLEKQENQVRRSEFSEENKMRQYASEIDLLNTVVKEKDEKGRSLEIRLIELYCLKEQQSRTAQQQKQLMDKTSEISMLREKIDELRAAKQKLEEQVKQNQLAELQLEIAKATISELQTKRDLDAKQIQSYLMLLKEQLLGICERGENKGYEVDKKLKAVKDLELKCIEMKRKNLELQLEKRELVVKLNIATAKIAELSCVAEHKIVAEFQEEIGRLKRSNDKIVQEIDELQQDRFSILEELIYQRWLNLCLRFELEDFRHPGPKKIKPIDHEKWNFRSDSNSSGRSSVDSTTDELTNSPTTSSSSDSAKKRRNSLIHNMKKWASSRDFHSDANASETRSPDTTQGRFRRFSTSSIPSSISSLRSRGENGLVSSSKNHEAVKGDSPERQANRRLRRVSFNDSINSIRYIDEGTPGSDHGTSDKCQKQTEMPSSIINNVQRQQNSQDLGTKRLDHPEICTSEMDDGASGDGKFCTELVNLILGMAMLFLFLVLFYFRILSAFTI